MVKTTKPKPVSPPPYESNSVWEDRRGVEYVVTSTVPYLTTWDLAKELGMYPESLYRWCVKWFGKLPPGRSGGSRMGYRIPLEYRAVARAWLMTEDPRIREVTRRTIVDNPKDWVVVVANVGSTHYSSREVVGRVQSLTDSPAYRNQIISVLYVGDT